MNPQEVPKKLILLAEDDKDMRVIYSSMLVKGGYEVEIAPDGDCALDMIRNRNWDLLLLDIMLPKIDGISILKLITQDKLKKGKIVVLTVLNNENIIEDAFKYGADGFIIKSEITPGGLLDEMKAYLQ